jgi:hypothetical protein
MYLIEVDNKIHFGCSDEEAKKYVGELGELTEKYDIGSPILLFNDVFPEYTFINGMMLRKGFIYSVDEDEVV